MLKSVILAAVLIGLHTTLVAQDNLTTFRDRSQFSVGLMNGVNTTRATTLVGVNHIQNSWDLQHVLRFAYRYRFSPKVYAEAGFGLGVQSIAYGYEQNGATPGVFDRHSLSYFSLARFDILGAYNLIAFDNKKINIIGGIGANRFSHIHFGTGVSYGGLGHQSSFDIETEDRFLALGQLGLEYARINKKQNEFSFRVFYQHGFQSFHKGEFTHNDNQVFSTGILSSPLRGLNFSFNYTFTRAQRMQRMVELSESLSVNRKVAKKEFKKEKRFIDPSSRFLTFGAGLAFSGTHFKNADPIFSRQKFGSVALNLSYEHGWKNNLFFEGRYNRIAFSSAQSIRTDIGEIGMWSTGFTGHFLSAGMGYRIQNPQTNFQFFNVHAGLGIGFTLQDKGSMGYGSGGISSGDYNFDYTYASELTGKVMPVLYLGISKDIRITNRLALNLAYNRQLGLTSVYQTTFNYSSTTVPELKTAQGKIRGTANSFQVGLKYKLR